MSRFCHGIFKESYGISRAKVQNYLKLLYFSEDNQFFQILLGIKSPDAGVENLFIYWPGRKFQQNHLPGKPPGHLDRVY